MFSPNCEVTYTLEVYSWTKHLFKVELAIPTHNSDVLHLRLPAWIPGSYTIRDFARNITTMEVCNHADTSISCRKVDKQTWMLETNGDACRVTYYVFAFDLSVRSAYINDEYAFCNGTSVFLEVEGADSLKHTLIIVEPTDNDKSVYTGMPQYNGHYHATDYLSFIDYPIYIGKAVSQTFEVRGVTMTLLFSGTFGVDCQKIVRDLIPLCEHHFELFGSPSPVEDYLFITLLSDTGFGGLEHVNSTALLYPRFDLPLVNGDSEMTDGYATFLSLCSHELFHTWHVKRIKPSVMCKPDLSKETYTNQLWIYEGFTSFYDDLSLARTGTITPDKYLELLTKSINRVMTGGGRLLQTASESSFDAWTRFYKQDANSVNHIVSYYTKGSLIALGLDLLLRKTSDGHVTLDSVMQLLWQKYGISQSGTPDDVIEQLCMSNFSIDVSEFVARYVHGTEDVPLADYLPTIGLSISQRQVNRDSSKSNKSDRPFGVALNDVSIGTKVTQVSDLFAGEQAGLQVDDIIIAAGGYIVNSQRLTRLYNSVQGSHLSLSVIRDGRLITLALPTKATEPCEYELKIDSVSRFNTWLGL